MFFDSANRLSGASGAAGHRITIRQLAGKGHIIYDDQ
jgi:hypothetical protein